MAKQKKKKEIYYLPLGYIEGTPWEFGARSERKGFPCGAPEEKSPAQKKGGGQIFIRGCPLYIPPEGNESPNAPFPPIKRGGPTIFFGPPGGFYNFPGPGEKYFRAGAPPLKRGPPLSPPTRSRGNFFSPLEKILFAGIWGPL